jgi:2-polyprenyl-6-methoxyphenol hydroxylase-like FAD-dependent oxidoreductase
MQFHLNGFRTGDPMTGAISSRSADAGTGRPLPAEVDVLIVGCGPAGLTLGAQFAAFPDLSTCIVDQRAGPLELGQADGVACRTMEMFNAFGFAERVMREGYWVNETSFWRPSDTEPAAIVRGGWVQDTEDGLSEFPHIILNQARVHEFFLDVMRNAVQPLEPHYRRRLVELTVERGETYDYPVVARFEWTREDGSVEAETVRARKAVGCDGARSTVRSALGLELRGDAANQAWGVMDVLAVTDFPDIRFKSVINSADQGSIVLIPREGGYLVRIYVEIGKLGENERASSRNMTVDHIIAAARKVLRPYSLDVREVAWWSIYEIGQRLCDRFDDVPPSDVEMRHPCVFIAGDACHTHSPKAGQGMNVSMQDAFNLGWKLAAVLRGQSHPRLLRSYSAERQAVAAELIDFDRRWAAMLAAPVRGAGGDAEAGVDPGEIQRYFLQHGHYTAGTATRYPVSLLIGRPTHQELASGFEIGTRFHSSPVIRLADGKPMHLGHIIEADGRWRLFAFAPNGQASTSIGAISEFCHFLAFSPSSPVMRYTPKGQDCDAVIDVRAIFQQPHRTLAMEEMPEFLLPTKGRLRLRDYEKIFSASASEDIFDLRGIDRARGCVVVVRPDQYVSHVLPLDQVGDISNFFDQFMSAS